MFYVNAKIDFDKKIKIKKKLAGGYKAVIIF